MRQRAAHAPRLHCARTTPSMFGFPGIIQAEPGIPGGKPETLENPGFHILGRYASIVNVIRLNLFTLISIVYKYGTIDNVYYIYT